MTPMSPQVCLIPPPASPPSRPPPFRKGFEAPLITAFLVLQLQLTFSPPLALSPLLSLPEPAPAPLRVYRETVLLIDRRGDLAWSPCGMFVAAIVVHPPRLLIWRTSTGTLVNEWALATPATAIPRVVLQMAEEEGVPIEMAFLPRQHAFADNFLLQQPFRRL